MRHIRQSLVINNFFTLASIVIISVTLTLYTKYILKEDKKDTLPCQKEIESSYKISNQKLLNSSMKALNQGYYKLDGGYIKSQNSNSKIEKFLTLDEVDDYFINSIGVVPKKNINKYLLIKYEIIEDDSDILKKKEYSGEILSSFRVRGMEIFRYYTKFRYYDKDEIASKIDCTIKVYKNYVKKL